jgi:hypothetical protein
MSDPRILLLPNIPKALHGCAPRVIFGKAWWDVERRKAYAAAGYCCEACGVPKTEAWPKAWLEAHEVYDTDWKKRTLVFVRLAAICPACHMFIHNGRLEMLLESGDITKKLHDEILAHGKSIIKKAGLQKEYSVRHDGYNEEGWTKWRMIVGDRVYGSTTGSYEEWKAGGWKNWQPITETQKGQRT